MSVAREQPSVKTYPPVPSVDDPGEVDDVFGGGHLWVQELLDGGHLRFRMAPSGALRFGDRDRTFRDGEVPLAYEHAVRHVREELDRGALREALEDPSSVVFFAEAIHRRAVDYDWHRTPSVLGFDVWDDDAGRFLPPDAVERVYGRLGLEPVDTFRKEVRAADFDADQDAIPASAWRDGPAAGLFLRSKTGERATLRNPAVDLEDDPEPLEGSAEELAGRYVTDERLRRVAADLEARDVGVGFDALFDRVYLLVLRAIHGRLTHGRTTVEVSEFRSAVAARTREWLADHDR
jgi:hypothetical protein